MRIFKGLLVLVIVTVVGITAAAAYITQVLDPNDLKPTLVSIAKKEQIDLQLNGNISWSFWPWLGISIEKVSASSEKWEFEADKLQSSLSILSFLSDQIVIDDLIVMVPKVKIKRENKKAKKRYPLESVQSSFRPIIVRQLKILDGEVTELLPELTLSRIQFSATSFSPVTASDFNLSGYIRSNKYQAPFEISAEVTPTHNFNGLTIKNAKISSRDLNMSYDGYLSTSLNGQYSGEGRLNIAKFSPRKWLRTGNFPVPNTFDLTRYTSLSLETGIKLSDEMLSLRPFTVRVDETSVDGRVDILLNPINIDLELLADEINLDLYSTSNNDTAKKILKSLLPPGTYKLDITSLRLSNIDIGPLGADLGVDTDEVTLGRLDAGIFGGEIRASGTHLLAPQITNLSGTISGVQFAKFTLPKPFDDLTGQAQASFDLRAAGQNVNEIAGSLSGPIRLKIKNAVFDPLLNVSATLCRDLGAIIRSQPRTFDELTISGNFEEGIVSIERIESRNANLTFRGSGRISLVSAAANIRGFVEIPDNGQLGLCDTPDILWGRKLSLICRGQIRNQTLECTIDDKIFQELVTKLK